MKKAPSVEMIPNCADAVFYQYKGACYFITGFLATLYKGMVWMDGKEKADADFWEMTHYKEESGDNSPVITAPSL